VRDIQSSLSSTCAVLTCESGLDEALLSAKQLAQQDGPLARDMSYLQQWMKRPDMGYVYLLGADSDVYEKPDLKELVNFKRDQGRNNLAARVVADFAVRMWRKMFQVVSIIAYGDCDLYGGLLMVMR
jgi:hypothetical protein